MRRRRRFAIGLGLALMLAAALLWQCRGSSTTSSRTAATMPAAADRTHAKPRLDPAKLARAALAGTVTDEAKQPIANARVCALGENAELDAELFRDPTCAFTDARGAYRLEGLLPARYEVGASAPSRWSALQTVVLMGTPRIVDLTVRGGGVEVKGTVADVTGGPIERALVFADGSFAESDAQGGFSLWVAPQRHIDVVARADGYADRMTRIDPPGTLRIVMTPEATLTGGVVAAASGEPVANARVEVRLLGPGGFMNRAPEPVLSDERGRFRVARLIPGQYSVIARTEHGYGRSETSTPLDLGARVDGVVVKLHAAARVEGMVVFADTKTPCDGATVELADTTRARAQRMRITQAGMQSADGVLPGRYEVRVDCHGALVKETYAPVVVEAADVVGVVWEVVRGATIEGRVTMKSGAPVIDGVVVAKGTARSGRVDVEDDGSYRITGLGPGSYELYPSSLNSQLDTTNPPVVDVRANAVVHQDIVLDDGGTVTGTIVDQTGAPVAYDEVAVASSDDTKFGEGRTDAAGRFTIRGLAPADYWVYEPWRKQDRVTIRANAVVTIRIVAEQPTGVIRGRVIDHAGRPVPDAYISTEVEREGEKPSPWRSLSEPRPILTNTDGEFVVTKLRADATYAVLAYRKTGAEGMATGARPGTQVTIQLSRSGSITGVVRRSGKPVEEFEVAAHDLAEGRFVTSERFFCTGGRFALVGLPGRRYRITASAVGSQQSVDVELGEGDARTLELDLDPLITITGRVLRHPGGKPVAGVRMQAARLHGSSTFTNLASVSDADGRFRIENAPRGTVTLFSIEDVGAHVSVVRTLNTSVDVGDLYLIARSRFIDADGDIGVEFARIDPELPADQRAVVVESIDPKGHAAASALKVGDVIVAIDGLDVTGGNSAQATFLTIGPTGSKVALTTKRGVIVELVR